MIPKPSLKYAVVFFSVKKMYFEYIEVMGFF